MPYHDHRDGDSPAVNPVSTGALTIAATSPRFLCNAVAVTSSGAKFLGLPRWAGMADTPSVVRVDAAGALVPFPGGAWNAWTAGKPVEFAFVQVNALHIFNDDTLWVVDQGAPDRTSVLPGAQKVLQFDTGTGTLLRVLHFDAAITPAGTQLNDLRICGDTLYLTDSGLGAIVVHDLASGRTLRRLSGHALLAPSDRLPMRGTGGRVLEDGDGARPLVGADFIEISTDGQWLYFGAPTGPLRRVATALLRDPQVNDAAIGATIVEVAPIPTLNGTAMDTLGNLYLADAEHRRIEVLAPSGRRAVLVSDERLVNPDALFISGDRTLFIPATQGERLPEHSGGHDALQPPFLVLALPLPLSVDGIALGQAIAPVPPTAAGTRSESPAYLARGIEHIGITVPDHEVAVRFFCEAFGAEPLFSLVRKGQPPLDAAALHAKNGLAHGTAIVAVTMLRLRHGPNVEVFEIDHPMGAPGQGIAHLGISHFALTVDDMAAVTARFAAAGGTLLEGPYDLDGQEQGSGNRGRFGRAPWGLLVEFESFGAPLQYDPGARATRWFPVRG